jgi:hypothetical protein
MGIPATDDHQSTPENYQRIVMVFRTKRYRAEEEE